MNINFGTLAFGYKIAGKGSTPNWSTALGQGNEYKINNSYDINEILKGMVYTSVSIEKVSLKLGKGGKIVRGKEGDSPIILASVFEKVYVNDILIDGGKYILIITKDTLGEHKGRLKLKYGISNSYESMGEIFSNQEFYNMMKKQLNLAEDACYFVSNISIRNQDELIFKTIIVNKDGCEEYANAKELHKAWEILDESLVEIKKEKNRIIFGAPGTGKSFKLEEDSKKFGKNVERVTFHPNYSYSQFVGTYKPVQGVKKTDICYEYMPGPFMRVYLKAMNNPNLKYLLLIEEINRANVAAVFGEIFQLLDRKCGISEYPIATSEDIKKYLFENLKCCEGKAWKGLSEDEMRKCLTMSIPDNMYIWATMNSADQGVFPMDTAFKRRWEFEYLSVNDNEQVAAIKDYVIPMCFKDNKADHYIGWDSLRIRINNILTSEKCKVNEDKLLGPFFISKNMLDEIKNNKEQIDELEAKDEASRTEKDNEALKDMHQKENSYIKAFESKVIMYLFEDVMKMRPENIFIGHQKKNGKMIFSEICKAFEQDGEGIFGTENLENI